MDSTLIHCKKKSGGKRYEDFGCLMLLQAKAMLYVGKTPRKIMGVVEKKKTKKNNKKKKRTIST